jgi:hypothetical protein
MKEKSVPFPGMEETVTFNPCRSAIDFAIARLALTDTNKYSFKRKWMKLSQICMKQSRIKCVPLQFREIIPGLIVLLRISIRNAKQKTIQENQNAAVDGRLQAFRNSHA